MDNPTSGKGKELKIILICMAAVLLLAAVAGIIYYISMVNKMNHVEVPEIQYTEAPTEAPSEPPVETTEATAVATEPPHIPSS